MLAIFTDQRVGDRVRLTPIGWWDMAAPPIEAPRWQFYPRRLQAEWTKRASAEITKPSGEIITIERRSYLRGFHQFVVDAVSERLLRLEPNFRARD